MKMTKIPNSLIRSRVHPNSKALYFFLASLKGQWPSFDEIRQYLCFGETKLKTAIKTLEKNKYMSWDKQELYE